MAAQPVRVAIDLETTGLQAELDSIIEVGAIKFAGGEVLETFESFVAPRVPLPYRVQRLTGIRPADLVAAPAFAAVAPALRAFLGDAPLVGHSVAFDAAFLRRVGLAHRNPLVDTYELASALLPNLPSYTLESVGSALGLASPTYHRALADAQLARDVFLALLERLNALDPGTMRVLGRLISAADWSPAYFVRGALRARGDAVPAGPGRPGLGALGSLGAQLTAKLGVDPDVLALAIAREPTNEPVHLPSSADPGAPAPAPRDTEDSPDTEDTSAPADAARQVAACLADGGVAMIETGGGAAGTRACLVPALRWAAQTGGRVLIAVAGLAAAGRLAREIAPQALADLGLTTGDLPVAEVGELSAYLCLHRWFGAATLPRDGALGRDLARGLAKIAVWSGATTTGLRGDVALAGPEHAAWERARAGDEFRDSSSACAYRRHGYCFVARAEAAAQSARVVVTTHAALAHSLSGTEHLIPDIERVVVLDAHLLEDELRRATAWSLERHALTATLADLASTPRHGERAGLLHQAALGSAQGLAQGDARALEATWFAQVRRAQRAADAFFAALGRLHAEAPGGSGGSPRGRSAEDSTARVRNDNTERFVCLDARARQLAAWPEVESAWEELERRLLAVARLAAEVAERSVPTGATWAADGVAADGVATDLFGARRALEDLCAHVDLAIAGSGPGLVHWVRPSQPPPVRGLAARAPAGPASRAQTRGAQDSGAQSTRARAASDQTPGADQSGEGNGGPLALVGAAADAGGMLAPLRAPGRALILADPALAVGGDFEYSCGALGLPAADVRTHLWLPSRADQTLLVIPEDVPLPNAPSYQKSLDEALVALGTTLGGRVVALFPSHAAVRAAYGGVRQRLEQAGVLVLAQGLDGSVRQLWQTFRNESRVVLLGAGAFWDGAELEDAAPACVVVTRLPFPSLSDPLQAARADLWQDPQAQFVVPNAALKVRQALNGLAWSHTRRNAVVLFDGRVTGRAYGASILATLPQCAQRHEPVERLAASVAEWVAAGAGTPPAAST